MKKSTHQRAVFLDRDGTIIEEKNYLHREQDVELVKGAADALKKLKQAGFLVFIVTNQAGVGRGYYTEGDVQRVHRFLLGLLSKDGALVDGIYFCPHHPDDHCNCRKPLPKFLFDAAAQFHIRLADSFMIGDRVTDLEAGRRAGSRSILVRTGYGETEIQKAGANLSADHVAKDLPAAVAWVLKQK